METKNSSNAWATENVQNQSSPRKSEPLTDHDGDNTTYLKFLLSNAEAGLIIGKGGSTIRDFRSQSGASILLSRNNECYPGTSDRIITVSGTVENVLMAAELIFSKILTEAFTDDIGDAEPRSRYNLVVPRMCCGRLIGKGGHKIKSFAAESGATIVISPPDENMYPGLPDRLLVLVGTIGEQLHALELILLELSEDPNYIQSLHSPLLYPGYNNMSDGPNGVGSKFLNSEFQNKEEGMSSVTFGVADEHMGRVLGRGGRNLIEISQLTGALIKISERGDFMPGTCDRKVTISGSPRAVHDAEAMVTRKVAIASER